jgi:integrase
MTKSRQGRSGDGLFKNRGIWNFRVVDWAGKRRTVSTRTRVFSDAQTFRKEHLQAIDNGADPTGSGRLTMPRAAERWLERRLIEASKETRKNYTTRVSHINDLLGLLTIGQINGDTIRRYQIDRRKEDAAPSCINGEVKVIGSILRENRLWTRIRDDVHLLKEPKSIGRCLTEDEMERLLCVAEERKDVSIIFLVMRLALETGMRHKEIRTLRRNCIQLKKNQIVIPRDSTKSESGARAIPLTAVARQIVLDLLERAEAIGSVEPEHYLFPGTDVGRGIKRTIDPSVPQQSFLDAWDTLRRLAKVDDTLRIHDLRHHVATDLAAAGVPSGVAMRLMGWSSPAMRRRYEHIQDSSIRQGIDALTAHRAQQQELREQQEQQEQIERERPTGRIIAFPRAKAV